jgi:hypothetical protein
MRRRTVTAVSRLRLLAILLLALAGCTDWRVQQVEPARFIRETQPREVRLGQRAGGTLQLRHPGAVGAAIWGLRGSDTVRISAAAVTTIAVKRTDWVETVILILTPPALLFGLGCLAACSY